MNKQNSNDIISTIANRSMNIYDDAEDCLYAIKILNKHHISIRSVDNGLAYSAYFEKTKTWLNAYVKYQNAIASALLTLEIE